MFAEKTGQTCDTLAEACGYNILAIGSNGEYAADLAGRVKNGSTKVLCFGETSGLLT